MDRFAINEPVKWKFDDYPRHDSLYFSLLCVFLPMTEISIMCIFTGDRILDYV